MADLFISYSRDDQEVARRFAENLKREGFEVWWDQALNPGEAFDQVTEEALAAAAAVIVLWSKTSVGSRWVRAEATQANADGRLLPVMVEACKRPIMFELTHTADLSSWKGNRDDAAWQSFVASVRRFVQRRGSAEPGADGEATTIAAPIRGPTLGQRLAAIGAGLGRAAAWAGSMLWRNAGRLAFALALAAIAAWITWQLRPRIEPEVVRFSIPLPAGAGAGVALAVSPDGRRLVHQRGSQIYMRRLDVEESIPIPGTEGAATLPFFSPDGASLGFFTADAAGTRLKAFDFSGEATRVLADVKDVPGALGSWDGQGHIYFDKMGAFGIFKVPAAGGEPEEFAAPGDYNVLRYPQALPGGRWVLFTAFRLAAGPWSSADLVAQNVTTGERKVVLKGGYFARYLPSGHLVFMRNGTLYAAAFDPESLSHGQEIPVVRGILSNEADGFAAYAVSDNGTLVYQPGAVAGSSSNTRHVVRADRSGARSVISSEVRNYSSPRASPDGSKIAVEVTGEDQRVNIWVMDVETGASTQLTFEGDEDRFPLWSDDGRDVLYTSRRGQAYALWRKAADGTGTARHVLDGSDALVGADVHGNTLILQERGEGGDHRDLFTLDLEKGGAPQPLLATPDDEVGGRVSPDGKWIAYVHTPRGGGTLNRRIYVRPFPDAAAGGQRAVSNGQGAGVEWSPRGDEIFYSVNGVGNTPLKAVPVSTTATTFTPGAPRDLFTLADKFQLTQTSGSLPFGYTYGVLPGKNEFIGAAVAPAATESAADASDAQQPRINVVLNWVEELKRFEALKRLVPVE